jgi:hypothetical protein
MWLFPPRSRICISLENAVTIWSLTGGSLLFAGLELKRIDRCWMNLHY